MSKQSNSKPQWPVELVEVMADGAMQQVYAWLLENKAPEEVYSIVSSVPSLYAYAARARTGSTTPSHEEEITAAFSKVASGVAALGGTFACLDSISLPRKREE